MTRATKPSPARKPGLFNENLQTLARAKSILDAMYRAFPGGPKASDLWNASETIQSVLDDAQKNKVT